MGCTLAAFSARAQSVGGPAWIGRKLIAAALWSMSAVGFYVASGLTGSASFILGAACVIYSVAGVLALLSLRALERYAILGLLIAALTYAILHNIEESAWPADFSAALLIEAMGLMAGLIIAAALLPKLQIGNTDDQ